MSLSDNAAGEVFVFLVNLLFELPNSQSYSLFFSSTFRNATFLPNASSPTEADICRILQFKEKITERISD